MNLKNQLNDYVLIIGSSNMDLNIYLDRLPKPGETVTGGTFKQSLGGKGANQAVASVRAGAKTMFIGKIGKDAFGDQMIFNLLKEGIETSCVIIDSKNPSGVAFIVIDSNGENMISVAPGANAKLAPEEIRSNSDIIKNAKVIVVQMELPMETIEEIYAIASKGNVIKILNPAPLKPISTELLKKIDIIIPNEGELYRLYELLENKPTINVGKDGIIEISKKLYDLGVKTIITTLGSKGCVIYEGANDEVTETPAFKVKAVDTVGAGDCFNGVLACKLCKGNSIKNAVKYATVAASIKVTRKGAQEGIPFQNEIEDKYKKM